MDKDKLGYLLNSYGEVIATVRGVKAGAVRYAYDVCKEQINVNRTHNLVNARAGRVSYAKKHSGCEVYSHAKPIADRELLIVI